MSEWFRAEHEWKAAGAQYLEVIRGQQELRRAAWLKANKEVRAEDLPELRPQGMDLDRVQTKLDAAAYGAPGAVFDVEAFAADVRLVFQNALDFNSDRSMFGVMAKLLLQAFEARLAHLKEAYGLSWSYTGASTKKSDEQGGPEGTELVHRAMRTHFAQLQGAPQGWHPQIDAHNVNKKFEPKPLPLFDVDTWRSFGITSLRADHYVRVGAEHCFRPREAAPPPAYLAHHDLSEAAPPDAAGKKRRRETLEQLNALPPARAAELADWLDDEFGGDGPVRKNAARDEVVVHLDDLDGRTAEELEERALIPPMTST